MGEVQSLKKVQITLAAAVAALAIGCAMMLGAQPAFATETAEAGSGTTAATYEVNKDAGTATYEVTKSTKKSVKVPATIKVGDKTYKVTTIAANAFKGTKATKVTVGKNVTKIAANAFKGSKVKTVKLTTKNLKKPGVKGSLKGSKVKTIKAPAKKVKAYKKIFKKSNSGKKVTVKK